MRIASILVLGSAALMWVWGCATSPGKGSGAAGYVAIRDGFIEGHFAVRPMTGVALGWHQYDGQFVLPDRAMLEAEVARLRGAGRALDSISEEGLNESMRQELALLRTVVALERWTLEELRPFQRNPMTYAAGLDVSVYLKRDFKPLAERLRDITAILRKAPEYLALAREQLDPVLPRPFVETAIESARGTADFLERDVGAAAEDQPEGGENGWELEFRQVLASAVGAFRSYAGWLQAERLPRADDRFALGREGYRGMLRAEGIEMEPERILEIGMRELRAEQARMAAAAAVIEPGLTPLAASRLIQRDHPTAAELIPRTRRTLESIRQFVIDRELLTIPSEVRARVEETLPPFRAVSFASMDTPGPFETRATEAYYYITPVEPDWTPSQAEEWLGAFNDYTTDIVSIHEAYPGHYVQFLALNASSAGVVAKVFPSYQFAEGWAHYTEQMMVEEGFGQVNDRGVPDRESTIRAAKYRIAQSIEALLRLCRLCCSIRLHTQGMTVEEATQFFMENAYYEEKPARSEAVRGTYDPGYLYYTLGKLMILKLREEWRVQEGAGYSLRRFHDELLRHGAPPIPLLRAVMLREPGTSNDLL